MKKCEQSIKDFFKRTDFVEEVLHEAAKDFPDGLPRVISPESIDKIIFDLCLGVAAFVIAVLKMTKRKEYTAHRDKLFEEMQGKYTGDDSKAYKEFSEGNPDGQLGALLAWHFEKEHQELIRKKLSEFLP